MIWKHSRLKVPCHLQETSIFCMLQAFNLGLQLFITAVCLWLNSSWFLPKHCGCRNQAMENASHLTLAFELWIPATLKFTLDLIARQLSFKDKPPQRYGNLPDFNCIFNLWKISTFHIDIRKLLRASHLSLSICPYRHLSFWAALSSSVIPESGFRSFVGPGRTEQQLPQSQYRRDKARWECWWWRVDFRQRKYRRDLLDFWGWQRKKERKEKVKEEQNWNRD